MTVADNQVHIYDQESKIDGYPTIPQRLEGDKQFANFWNQLPAGLENLKLVDIGCGNGDITKHIALLNPKCHVTGIDISEPFLKQARDSAADVENVEFKLMNLCNMDGIADSSVDYMISVFSCQVKNANDIKPLCKHFASKLKKGGKIRILINTIGGKDGGVLPPVVLDNRVYPLTLKYSDGQLTSSRYNLLSFGLQESEVTRAMTSAGFDILNVHRLDSSDKMSEDYEFRNEMVVFEVIIEAVLS